VSAQIAIRCARVVDVPADLVWEIVRDVPRWPQWDPYIVRLERVGEGQESAWEPGTQWDETVRRGPFRPRFRVTVEDGCGQSTVCWRGRYLFIQAMHSWSVVAVPDGVEVRSLEVFDGPRPILLAAGWLFRLFRVKQMAERSLEALTALAVSRHTNGPPAAQ
jgi:hypothetical protein